MPRYIAWIIGVSPNVLFHANPLFLRRQNVHTNPSFDKMLTTEYPTQDLYVVFEKVAMEDRLAINIVNKIDAVSPAKTKAESTTTTLTDNESYPPKAIFIRRDRPVVHSVPFAQLGYDYQDNIVVPMLRMSSNGRMAKGPRRLNWINPDIFPMVLAGATDDDVSDSSSDGSISTLTVGCGFISRGYDDDSSVELTALADESNVLLLKRNASSLQSPTITCSVGLFNFLKSAKKFRLRQKRMKLNSKQDTSISAPRRRTYESL